MANKGERYSKETAEKIIGLFSSLPPSDEGMNTESFVQYIKDAVVDMQHKGYSNESIASLLQENGIKIKPGTLKTYLSSKKGGRTRSRRSSGHAPARTNEANGSASANSNVNAFSNTSVNTTVDTKQADAVNSKAGHKTAEQATHKKGQESAGSESGKLTIKPDTSDI